MRPYFREAPARRCSPGLKRNAGTHEHHHHQPELGPAPALLVGERQELVEGAANLEGARPLQILALEEDAVARGLVEGAARDHGRAMDVPLQAARGLPNVVDGDGIHGADYRAAVEAGYTARMRTLTAVVASVLLLQGCSSLLNIELVPRIRPLHEETVNGSAASCIDFGFVAMPGPSCHVAFRRSYV